MPDPIRTFTAHEIGSGPVRFPSGAPIPTASDMSVDPYARTRVPKGAQVEGFQFWPQPKGTYPGVLLLHDRWGLTAEIKEFGVQLACQGYTVLAPNLYCRQGGMVTANAEVAETLMSRLNETDLIQDLTACCDFLNMREQLKRNVFALVGLGLGGSLVIRFACHRKRLRGAVAFYAKVTTEPTVLKNLQCPLLYHRAGSDDLITQEELDHLPKAAEESGKRVDIQTYEGAAHEFISEFRKDAYRADAAQAAWASTFAFLAECFKADR